MAKYEARARIEKVKTGNGATRYYVEREFKHDGVWRGFETITGLEEWEAKREAARSPKTVDIEDGTERQHTKSKVQNDYAASARNAKFKVGDRVKVKGVSPLREDFHSGIGTITKVMERGNGAGYHVAFTDGRELPYVESQLVSANTRVCNEYGTRYIDEGDRVFVVSKKKKGIVKSFKTVKGPQPIISVKYDDGSIGVVDANDLRVIPNSSAANCGVRSTIQAVNAALCANAIKPGDMVKVEWEYDADKKGLVGMTGEVMKISSGIATVAIREKGNREYIVAGHALRKIANTAKNSAARNADDPGHFTPAELSALKGAFNGLKGAKFSQYPNKSWDQLSVRGDGYIQFDVRKYAGDGDPIQFSIRGQGPRTAFKAKFVSSLRDAVTSVKRMLAAAKKQSPYSFGTSDFYD